ncbi:hypothetical protein DFH09DRAFT_1095457 [Mycena vulgaris]|nr:hypothetical protein DFH09DRAFT_1095457 [Mycena vulgaris]
MDAAPCTRLALRHARDSRIARAAPDSCRKCSARAFYAKQLGILRKINREFALQPSKPSLQRKQANGTEQTEMVGLPIGPDAELPEIAADMVPGYVYGMWVSMQCIDKAAGEEARKIWTVANSPATLLLYEHSGRQQPSGSSSVAGLKCGTWGGCLGRSTSSVFSSCSAVSLFNAQVKVLHEILSIEEESKGGLLRESWFQSTLDIPAGAEENTFLLYVMAPSAGIHRYLTHTFKVADVINCTVTLQRADIPDNSIKTIEHCYSRLSSSIPAGEHIARWDQFSKDVSGDNVDETRRLDELIKTGDSDGRQNPSRSYVDVSRSLDHPKVSLKDDETMLYSIAVKDRKQHGGKRRANMNIFERQPTKYAILGMKW